MERLTQDITVDILSRLPICSLICCRCVCKTWHTIISDPAFFTLQQHHFPFFDLFFQYVDVDETVSGSSQVSDFYLAFGNEDKLEEDDNKLDFRLSLRPSLMLRPSKKVHVPFFLDLQKDTNVLGSCNGFLVVSTIWNTQSDTIFPSDPIRVYNPITREHLQLPCIQISPEFGVVEKFLSGFGFDDVTQEFKFVILLFYVSRGDDVFESTSDEDSVVYVIDSDVGESESDMDSDVYLRNRVVYDVSEYELINNEMHVYSFRSNTWRKETGNVPIVLLDTCQVFSYVFVNGSLYWSAIDGDSRLHIVSLHLGSEDFGEIQTPDLPFLEENTSKRSDQFALGVLEKCLSLVDYSDKNFIHIWQMKNDNGNEYWIKLFCIDKDGIHPSLKSKSFMCLEYGKKGEILLMGRSLCVVYNAENSTCKPFGVADEDDDNDCRAIPFVGSLFSIRAFGMM